MNGHSPHFGESIETAIPVTALNSARGIDQESDYLRARFGREGVDWFFRLSELIPKEGRWFECVIVETAKEHHDIYFDITLLMNAQNAFLRGLHGFPRSRLERRGDGITSLSSFAHLMWQARHCWARIAPGK